MLTIRSFIGTHDEHWEDPQFYTHDSVELTAVLTGHGRFRWGQRESLIEPGHIVAIPSGVAHSFHAVSPIRFGVILVDGMSAELQALFETLLEQTCDPNIITLSHLDKQEYEALFRQWLKIASSSLKEPERNASVWLQVLMLFLAERSSKHHQAASIADIADEIRQHPGRPVHIADLAKRAGLTEDGLRKRFYKSFGVSPKRYQQLCRLQEAKWLLSTSDSEIGDIAAGIGFEQLHSFSAWFKKMEGVSPSEWRKTQRLYHE
jgi:AraC-like DNA-binding protein